MITEQHNDGGCFKLTIEYTNYNDITKKYIRYGESFEECLAHGTSNIYDVDQLEGLVPIDFRIQDDSK